MQNYLLLCRSITHAQRVSSALEAVGVRGGVVRPPIGLSEKGCGYAVRIGAVDFPFAMQRLRSVQLMPERVFAFVGVGKYQEIRMQ